MLEPLKKMFLIRAFELKVDALFKEGVIGGTTHLSVGQEACAVGAADGLRPDDPVVSTHRGHGHFLAKGGDPRRIMAELFGKAAGVCGGVGGSQHMADFSISFMGSNGITGGGIPIATGIALAEKMKNSGAVTLCFLGDGAVNQGTFHESLNLAAVLKLPVIYFCENNLYAMSTPFASTSPVARVADRACAYNIPGVTIDGNDYIEVRDTVREWRERVRGSSSPVLIEALTYRHLGHSKSDTCEYRTREEEEEWKRKDPISRYIAYATARGVKEKQIEAARAEAERIVEEAVAFAREAPFPA